MARPRLYLIDYLRIRMVTRLLSVNNAVSWVNPKPLRALHTVQCSIEDRTVAIANPMKMCGT